MMMGIRGKVKVVIVATILGMAFLHTYLQYTKHNTTIVESQPFSSPTSPLPAETNQNHPSTSPFRHNNTLDPQKDDRQSPRNDDRPKNTRNDHLLGNTKDDPLSTRNDDPLMGPRNVDRQGPRNDNSPDPQNESLNSAHQQQRTGAFDNTSQLPHYDRILNSAARSVKNTSVSQSGLMKSPSRKSKPLTRTHLKDRQKVKSKLSKSDILHQLTQSFKHGKHSTTTGQTSVSWIANLQSVQSPKGDNDDAMTSVSWIKTPQEFAKNEQQVGAQQTMSNGYSFLENLNAIGADSDQVEHGNDDAVTDYSFMNKLNEIQDKSKLNSNQNHGDIFISSNVSDVQDLIGRGRQTKDSITRTLTKQTSGKGVGGTDADINTKFRKSLPHLSKKPEEKNHVISTDRKGSFHPPISLAEVKRRYSKTKRKDVPEELYRLAPDVFDKIPPPRAFLDQFQSPCWRDVKQRLHCLPSFYLAGMPKCATTDLWAKINAHHEVYARAKEPHWWTRRRIGKIGASQYQSIDDEGHIQKQSLKKYLDRTAAMAEMMDITGEQYIAGDGSASTFWDNRVWEAYYPKYHDEGPPYVIGDVIHAISPKAKIIVVLRNPIDRLYSSYWYFWVGRNPTNRNFHKIVVKEVSAITKCLKTRSMRVCSYSMTKDLIASTLGITTGFYDVFVEDWLRSFPREQLLILKLEDWSNRCHKVLPSVYKFLEIAPLKSDSIDTLCNVNKTHNPGPDKHGEDMLPETRTLLEEIYRPHLDNLAELLEESKWYWGMLPES